MRLFDTARGEVVPFETREPGRVAMYVCGPTVYDVPHLGHGRHLLVWDVLRRYLRWRGEEVTFVSNITDIDDNIIRRAEREGSTEAEVAATYEAAWYVALDALGVERPDADPHATAYVDRMVALVGELVDRGAAYETGDGVYFATDALEGYGLLARQPLDSLRAGARVEVDDEKRSPVDFALWKKAKPGEPTWPSPWGPGRPGWHTECVVMSLDLLGEGFDLHGGGIDLAFPHHENERAQAVALGRRSAAHWGHHAHVVVGAEKMSKSLGNFTSLTDLLSRTDGRAYRLLVLQSHYRSPVEVTADTVEAAVQSLARLDALVRRLAPLDGVGVDEAVRRRFAELVDEDLDTPRGMAAVFEAVSDANRAADEGDAERARALAATVVELGGALGLVLSGGADDALPGDVSALVAERDAARAARSWAAADGARDRLVVLGWLVEDTPAGTKVRRGT